MGHKEKYAEGCRKDFPTRKNKTKQKKDSYDEALLFLPAFGFCCIRIYSLDLWQPYVVMTEKRMREKMTQNTELLWQLNYTSLPDLSREIIHVLIIYATVC